VRGDLRQSSLPDVMRHLYAERKNGLLHLSQESVTRRIHFKKGVPVFADAADGQVPTRDQATDLLYSLFSWTEGMFVFMESETNVDEEHALSLSPSVAILEGSRRIGERHILERLTGGPQSVFSCTETSELPLFTMKLSSAESAILNFARDRERFTAQDLPVVSEGLEVVNALNALLSVGLLEIVNDDEVTEPKTAPAPSAAVTNVEPAPSTPPTEGLPAHETAQRSEVESLLDTFEAKRGRALSRSSNVPPTSPPPLPVVEATANPEEPKASEPEPLPSSAPPESMEERLEIAEPVPPLEPPPPESTPSQPAAPSAASKVTHVLDQVVRFIPAGKAGKGVLVGVMLVLLSLFSWLWLSPGDDETPSPNDTIVENSTPSATEQAAPVPPPKTPEPESEPKPEPSDADLFYSANLAFENGDYERSKEELSTLLERRPDFHPARELMGRVDLKLAPVAAKEETRPPQRVVATPKVPETIPPPDPKSAHVEPPAADPDALFDEARRAFARGALDEAGAKLDELEKVDAAYEGAQKLRGQLTEQLWERKLPVVLTARHDHALGGCEGVLTLTKTGYGYRSKEHEWVWSFREVAETERRDANRLRIETRARSSFNFDLRDPLSDDDWARHQALGSR
jgi:hypothetical protein